MVAFLSARSLNAGGEVLDEWIKNEYPDSTGRYMSILAVAAEGSSEGYKLTTMSRWQVKWMTI